MVSFALIHVVYLSAKILAMLNCTYYLFLNDFLTVFLLNLDNVRGGLPFLFKNSENGEKKNIHPVIMYGGASSFFIIWEGGVVISCSLMLHVITYKVVAD